MIIEPSDIKDPDGPSAIGASWRGENRIQIAHIPYRVCEPRENHSFAGDKSMDMRTGGVNWFRLACDVRGPMSNWEIPDKMGDPTKPIKQPPKGGK